jgi:hypothetical protein
MTSCKVLKLIDIKFAILLQNRNPLQGLFTAQQPSKKTEGGEEDEMAQIGSNLRQFIPKR